MHRTVKSFVLRAGRVSPRQQEGLTRWLPTYELAHDGMPWDLKQIFGRDAPTIMEIGFGMGHSLTAMAKANPDKNYIGVEVHRAGIGSLVADLHQESLTNVRVATFDAVEVLTTYIANQALAGVQIFFPDPWPKKRHHKRRLIQTNFVQLIVNKLNHGGFLHCATDWEDYALQILEVCSREPMLKNQQADGGFSPRPGSRPMTKFEQRGERLGHGVWDILCNRM